MSGKEYLLIDCLRSPYGPDGTENLALLYVPFGYAVVMQNQRGTGWRERLEGKEGAQGATS
jgi:hypothetical protein